MRAPGWGPVALASGVGEGRRRRHLVGAPASGGPTRGTVAGGLGGARHWRRVWASASGGGGGLAVGVRWGWGTRGGGGVT